MENSMTNVSTGQVTSSRGFAPIAISESEAAQALGVSVHFLRKDRQTKRLLPFYKLGGAVRYNLERVREALAAVEEGGTLLKARARAPRSAA
jgi:hypothetical protein